MGRVGSEHKGRSRGCTRCIDQLEEFVGGHVGSQENNDVLVFNIDEPQVGDVET